MLEAQQRLSQLYTILRSQKSFDDKNRHSGSGFQALLFESCRNTYVSFLYQDVIAHRFIDVKLVHSATTALFFFTLLTCSKNIFGSLFGAFVERTLPFLDILRC